VAVQEAGSHPSVTLASAVLALVVVQVEKIGGPGRRTAKIAGRAKQMERIGGHGNLYKYLLIHEMYAFVLHLMVSLDQFS
jgi:hypothetical protein